MGLHRKPRPRYDSNMDMHAGSVVVDPFGLEPACGLALFAVAIRLLGSTVSHDRRLLEAISSKARRSP